MAWKCFVFVWVFGEKELFLDDATFMFVDVQQFMDCVMELWKGLNDKNIVFGKNIQRKFGL